MAKLTAKSQRERKVKCRDCYLDMGIQLRLDGGSDWLCPRCGRIWPIPLDAAATPEKAKRVAGSTQKSGSRRCCKHLKKEHRVSFDTIWCNKCACVKANPDWKKETI